MKKFLVTFLMLGSLQTFAANPYTDCGIGAALFPNTNWAAVTSNVIWDVGTTALISATASEDTCSGGEAQTAMLIHDKLETLESQMMLEDGNVLASLTETMNCGSANINSDIRASYKEVLADTDYSSKNRVEKSESIYFMLKNNSSVQQHCSIFS